jgi:hypothetical protein
MDNSQLLLFLSPWAEEVKGHLPTGTISAFPFYQTVSRLNYRPDIFNCKLYGESVADLLKLAYDNSTFSQTADARAQDLLAKSHSVDRVFVMWSGGIDSTVALTSIYKNWPDSALSKLTVLCNGISIKENPEFFKFIVSKKTNIETSSPRLEPFLKQGLVITGELGDQIFGSDIVGQCVKLFGEDVIHRSWSDYAPKYFETLAGDGYDRYQPIVDEAPFKLNTVYDFFWWLNFTQKWQHVQLRTLTSKTWTDPKSTFKNLVHFFDTPEFQLWSINNHHLKIKNTWTSYKFTAKEYVIDYTKDESFLNKKKVPSLINLYAGYETNWAIDTDWNYLDKQQAFDKIK